MGTVHGVFRGMKVRAGAIGDFSLDPFSFQHHDRFGSLRVPVGGDDRSRGETAQEKACPGVGIMRKGREFDAGIGTRLPESGVGQAEDGEHPGTLPERFLPDNRPSL